MVYLLADKQKQPLAFEQSGMVTRVKLTDLQPDPYISVVVAEYREKPDIEQGLVAQTIDGGYSLLPQNVYPELDNLPVQAGQRRGTVPEHLPVSTPIHLKWKIYVSEAGRKSVDVSYSFQGNNGGGKLCLASASQTLEHVILPTGKTVGEPKSDWVIDNFKSHRLGEINFPAAGMSEISVEMEPGNKKELDFQWIWIQ